MAPGQERGDRARALDANGGAGAHGDLAGRRVQQEVIGWVNIKVGVVGKVLGEGAALNRYKRTLHYIPLLPTLVHTVIPSFTGSPRNLLRSLLSSILGMPTRFRQKHSRLAVRSVRNELAN